MIRLYQEGEHGGGFVGYRVAVSVDSQLLQKYLSFKKYSPQTALAMAINTEKKWLADQAYHLSNRVFSKHSNTGVVGLHFRLERKKGRKSFSRKVQFSIYREGQRVHKSWHITTSGLTNEKWFDICTFIRNIRAANDNTLEQLVASKPSDSTVEQSYEKLQANYGVKAYEK